uniref:Uncharacterized protein n=1 Tax=Pseudo-nitzschia australis TaxID=44445 RepID=A0A6U9ZH85_9STRA|mmetsp:Transcript_317/g.838  ORF Transcript_317/g.838 Transcript_317/m.838 type:complete len:276 (+) Transcript_317:384-1211(+)
MTYTTMMVEEHMALTVADLCSTINESANTSEFDDHSHSTIDYSYIDDEDSFLANNSLCKQHKSTIKMLDSLRKEVIQMVRSDGNYGTPSKSPRDVTIDLNRITDLSSPLGSPVIERDTVSLDQKVIALPSLSNKDETSPCRCIVHASNDDGTFCSMDNSINNEMNILKEVARDLEKELKEATMNTVFEAVERIGESDDPQIRSVLESGDKDVIREGIRNEIKKQEQSEQQPVWKCCYTDIKTFILSLEGGSMNIKVLIVSIAFGFMRKFIAAWAA